MILLPASRTLVALPHRRRKVERLRSGGQPPCRRASPDSDSHNPVRGFRNRLTLERALSGPECQLEGTGWDR